MSEDFREVLSRLDAVLKEVRELKKEVEKAVLTEYTAEEALQKVVDKWLETALPEWFKWELPLEALEHALVPYLVYEEDIKRAIKHLVKKGLISVRNTTWEDIYGKKHRIKMFILSKQLIPEKPKPEAVSHLVNEFYYRYWRLHKKHLTKGDRVSVSEYEEIVTEIFRFGLWWMLKPFAEAKILYSKEHVRDFVAEIDDYALWNLLKDLGIAEDEVDSEGAVVALKILADENSALQMIEGRNAE